ncbi:MULTISPECIES: fimbrial protein [unclassified Serratia (in: enterobacteria)]|uniref:fimbrial protein n=1 Tax=unclassified Serratia (in: enterobacteria) TaxID=2647522 RepID=UPI003075F267
MALAFSCTVQSQTIAVPNLVVQRDAPVGTDIGTTLHAGLTNIYTCDDQSVYAGIITDHVPVMTGSNGVKIFPTGLEGLGCYLFMETNTGGYGFIGTANAVTGYTKENSASLSTVAGRTYQFAIGFVKTGTIPYGSSNRVAAQTVGTFVYSKDSEAVAGPGQANISGFNVAVLACSLQTTSINVVLDAVKTGDLTRTGTTAKPKVFNLGLNCDPDANINVRIDGTQDPDTAATGVLKANSTGSASGVGIQLLYNGSPFKLNNTTKLKTSAGGAELLPFTAQYYQTKEKVTPGPINAAATLTITYQ